MSKKDDIKIAIVGLGYVGLPLLLELSKHFSVLGYDLNERKINSLLQGIDLNKDLNDSELELISSLPLSSDISSIKESNFIIVSVPTPVDINNNPDLENLIEATKNIAQNIREGTTIVFESTV